MWSSEDRPDRSGVVNGIGATVSSAGSSSAMMPGPTRRQASSRATAALWISLSPIACPAGASCSRRAALHLSH